MDSSLDIARAVAAVARMDIVPTLLNVLCESTGMRFAAVTRNHGKVLRVCAQRDELQLGVQLGAPLTCLDEFGLDAGSLSSPLVIVHANIDRNSRTSVAGASCSIESFIVVPIVFKDQRHFGNLCALDSMPVDMDTLACCPCSSSSLP